MFTTHFSIFFRLSFFLTAFFAVSLRAQFQIITPNPAEKIQTGSSFDSNRPIGVRIVAPRNSAATGAVVIRNAQQAVSAQISPLRSRSGGPSFPANLLQIRYGFKGMHDEPQSGSDQVIWITANVPPNAPPGDYLGQIQLPAQPPIPLKLEVGKWIAPRPAAFGIWQNYLHSPETIQRHYNLTLWSEKHFEYMVPSLRLLGQMGAQVLYLPLTGKTHFGNDHTLLRWTGSGDTYQPEFSALETYFTLWNQHIGPPRAVILYMKEPQWWRDNTETINVTQVSRPGDSGGRAIEFPHLSAPGQAERWRPAFAGIVQRIQAMGWDQTQILLGMVSDERDFSEEKEHFFANAAPGIPWAAYTHGRGDPPIPKDLSDPYSLTGLTFQWVMFPYDPDQRFDFAENPLTHEGNWRDTFPFLTSMRQTQPGNFTEIEAYHPFYWRVLALAAGWSRYRGFGRMGTDFWDVDGRPIIGLYHRWHNLYRNNPRSMTYPGPKGALSTQSVEMAREGNAATEALRVLHDALTVSNQRSKISGNLRKEVETAYLDYYTAFRTRWQGKSNELHDNIGQLANTDWQTTLRTLYDAAGDVSAALGTPPPQPVPALTPSPRPEPTPAPAPVTPPELAGELRTWTSTNGQTVEAVFLGYKSGQIALQLPNGQTTPVPMASLSEDDRTWVRSQAGFRLWRNPEGEGIEALFIEFLGPEIIVETSDGEKHRLPTAKLHPEDLDFVLDQLE